MGEDRVRIEYDDTEGPRGEVTLSIPRLVDVQTGEVLFSLWGSWFQGPIEWAGPSVVRMHLGKVASADAITIDVDVDARTYRVVADQLVSEHAREFIRKAMARSPLRRAPRLAAAAEGADLGHLIGSLSGEWTGAYRVWLEPGALRAECTSTLTARSVLGGRFAVLEYDWTVDGQQQHGQMLVGPGPQMAWVDEWHNGDSIMFCSATPEPGDAGFDVLGSYGPPDRPWGWRTTIALPEPDVLIVTAWNVSPEGEQAMAVQAAYQRRTP